MFDVHVSAHACPLPNGNAVSPATTGETGKWVNRARIRGDRLVCTRFPCHRHRRLSALSLFSPVSLASELSRGGSPTRRAPTSALNVQLSRESPPSFRESFLTSSVVNYSRRRRNWEFGLTLSIIVRHSCTRIEKIMHAIWGLFHGL